MRRIRQHHTDTATLFALRNRVNPMPPKEPIINTLIGKTEKSSAQLLTRLITSVTNDVSITGVDAKNDNGILIPPFCANQAQLFLLCFHSLPYKQRTRRRYSHKDHKPEKGTAGLRRRARFPGRMQGHRLARAPLRKAAVAGYGPNASGSARYRLPQSPLRAAACCG